MSIIKKITTLVLINTLILIALFIILEIGSRFYSYFINKNLCAKDFNFNKYKSLPHYKLGYIPYEGIKFGCNGEKYTINNKNIRIHNYYAEKTSKTLIVGDSFGYGAEVSDNDTVGYYLSKNYKIHNINAAVYGYGLDQALLRAEILINENKNIKNILLITSTGGIGRTSSFERNFISKPYFSFEEKEKKLKLNYPSNLDFSYASNEKFFQKFIIVRFLMDKTDLSKLIPREKKTSYDPVILSCEIILYYKKKFEENNKTFNLILYRDANEILNNKSSHADELFLCLEKNDINYFDTKDILTKNSKKNLYIKNYRHPTKISNEIVSRYIFKVVSKNLL